MIVRAFGFLAAGVSGLLILVGTAGGLLVSAAQGPTPAAGGGLIRPVTGATVTQPFGCTSFALEPSSSSCPSGHFHSGIDLAVSAGTPVHGTAGGTAHVIASATGFGLHVVVDHGDGLSSLYGHLSAVAISDGEAVVPGEVIGAVGSTGNSTGPHLHFEIRRDGVPEDPARDMVLP